MAKLRLIQKTALTLDTGDIHTEPVYLPKSSYPAAAGLNDFDPSTAESIIGPVAMTMVVYLGDFLTDPHASIAIDPLPEGEGDCRDTGSTDGWAPCDVSYFLSGGMLMVSPMVDNFTKYTEAIASVVPKTKGYHVEFGAVSDEESFFSNSVCKTYGREGSALHLCLSQGLGHEIMFGRSNPSEYFLLPVRRRFVNPSKPRCSAMPRLTNAHFVVPFQHNLDLIRINHGTLTLYVRLPADGNRSLLSPRLFHSIH